MMTDVSAIAVRRGKRFWSGVAQRAVALVLVAAGIFALWYRQAYNVWPGQAASARVHWCGRDYQYQGSTQTWRKITSQARWPVRAVGRFHRSGGRARSCSPRSIPRRCDRRTLARRRCTCVAGPTSTGLTVWRAARDGSLLNQDLEIV